MTIKTNTAHKTQRLELELVKQHRKLEMLTALRAIAPSEAIDAFGKAGSAIALSKEAKVKQRIQAGLAEKMGELAASPEKFHAMMKTVYGEGYDRNAAEALRKRALAGDTSWMPEIRFVDPSTLQGGNGAYDAESDVVYLNNTLDLATAIETYVEESAHHVDTMLNKSDAAGDEGELFRRLMAGEKLSSAQIRDIKSENDKGTIVVDGKRIEVEFWKPFQKLKKAFKKIGHAIKNAFKKVGQAVKTVVTTIGKTIAGAVVGLAKGIGGFFKGVFTGHPLQGLRSLWQGIDEGLIRAPVKLAKGLFKAGKQLLDGATGLLGPLGKPLNGFGTRVLSAAGSIVSGAAGIVQSAFWTPLEAGSEFLKGQKNAWNKLFHGDFKGFGREFGMSFVRSGRALVGGAVDGVARVLALAGTAVGTLIGVESTPRSLTPEQRATFEELYGDSLDLDLVEIKAGGLGSVGSARTVGNTIYLPKNLFDSKGQLTAEGWQTLKHEMGHVWQNQNGGGDYLHKALLAQLIAKRREGDRSAAYGWEDAANEGRDFEELNPEQQANVLEMLADLEERGLPIQSGVSYRDNNGTFHSLSAAEATLLADARDDARDGRGAP